MAKRPGTEAATRDGRGGLDVAVESPPEGHPPGTVARRGRAQPGPAAPAVRRLSVLGLVDLQLPGPPILVDSRLGAEAPRADALSGGLVPIRGKLAMRAMRPAVAAAQWLRGGVVPQPAPAPRADGCGPLGRDGDPGRSPLGYQPGEDCRLLLGV